MVDNTQVVGFSGTILETGLAISQANETFQIIQIVFSVITLAVTLAYTIWKWYRAAKKKDSDGGEKITPKEVADLFEDLKKEVEEDDRD